MLLDSYSFHITEERDRVVLWRLCGAPRRGEWLATMEAATLWLSDLESRGQRTGVVIDTSELLSTDAETLRIAGLWRAQQMALIANTCICACYVAPSALLRGAISAVFWLAGPVIPVTVKPSRDESLTWVDLEVRRILGSQFPPPAAKD